MVKIIHVKNSLNLVIFVYSITLRSWYVSMGTSLQFSLLQALLSNACKQKNVKKEIPKAIKN